MDEATKRAEKRIMDFWNGGTRRWMQPDGEIVEVLSVDPPDGNLRCCRVKTDRHGELGYTLRSLSNWQPMPSA